MTGVRLQDGQAELPTPHSTHSYWHKEPSRYLLGHRTTRDLGPTADVVVIGSGIAGAFAARDLVARGRSVVMLEAREACWGATGRNGGHCQPLIWAKAPHIARFELATFHLLQDLIEKHSISCDWKVIGGVHKLESKELVETAAQYLDKLRRKHPDLADKATLVTDSAGLDALRVIDAAGAVYQPNAAKCWPYKLVCWLLEELLRENPPGRFNLQTNTPVEGLQRGETSWIVHTERGQIVAKDVLLATNAYTSQLLPRMTGLIVPVRGQVCALTPPNGSKHIEHSYSWLVGSSDDYLIQRDGSNELILGGGRLVVPGGEEGVSRDDVVNPAVSHHLHGAMRHNVQLRPGGTEEDDLGATFEWTGIMGYSRDKAPWVGRVPEELGGSPKGHAAGLWICAGFTGHGMPVAARCGIAVSELIAGYEGGVTLPPEFKVSPKRADEAAKVPTLYSSDLDDMRALLARDI